MRTKGALSKQSESISNRILEILVNPLSTRQIHQVISSDKPKISWKTIRNYLEKLEINKKVYQLTDLKQVTIWAKTDNSTKTL